MGVTAISAASTAIVALTKQSIESYAEYEQLIGGVETLYGATYTSIEEYTKATGASFQISERAFEQYQKRSQIVLENASNEYKTAGLSVNEYMNTVNCFAASLTSSLGGYEWQAANYADMIVKDMADNANKMGTSMESIQNAYSGFAKGNFTMLDNLKLGYGGTKEEMERLLRKAEELAGYEVGSLDISSFADVSDAIHIIQEDMGITGTTAREAASTIQGSASMMQAAWANLVTGMSDSEADIGELFDNLIESAEIFLENLLPVAEQALYSITELIGQLAPVIIEKLPALAEQILPALLNAATAILSALGAALPGIFDALSATIIQISGTLSTTLKDGLLSPESLQKMFDSAFGLLISLGEAVIENLPVVVSLGLELLIALANGIAVSLPELIPTIVDVVLQIVDTLTDPTTLTNLIDAAIAIVVALANALLQDDVIGALIAKAPEIIQNLVTAIVNNVPKLLTAASEIVIKLATGIIDKLSDITDAATEIVNTVVDGVKALGKDLLGVGKNIVEGVKNGIKEAWKDMKTWLATLFGDIITIAKNILGIKSPSRVFAEIGMFLDEGLAKGIKDYSDVAVNATEEMIKEVEDAAQVDASKLVVTPKIETKKATGAIEGVDFNALATSSIDGIASIAKSVDYNALVNASIQGMSALVDLFKSGEAKVGVGNTRDLRRALNA